MAFSPANTILFTFLLLSAVAIRVNTVNADESVSMDEIRSRLKSEKLTHLRVYLHDLIVMPNGTTSVKVAEAANITSQSATNFGAVFVIDDALTTGPNRTSKLVGRAQGIYVFSSQEELSLLMAFNIVFTEGKYNGSSITILGRNAILTKLREMPIIGGTGAFRFARGFAQVRTVSLDSQTGNGVLDYNLYVLHY